MDRHGEMRCAENGHKYPGGQVMQPNGSTQEVKHWKYRKRHRDKEERMAQQEDLPIK